MYSPEGRDFDWGGVGVAPRGLLGAPRSRISLSALIDHHGWLAAVALCAAYVLYIGHLTSFPLQDYPNHIARATALADLLFHHGERFGALFEWHFAPVPYLLHDLVLASLIGAFGGTLGPAIFSGLVLLSLPAALLFYMHTTGVAPRARLLIFLLSLYLATDFFFLMAFMAFRLALALTVVNMALLHVLHRQWSWRTYGIYLAVLGVGYFTHLTTLVLFIPLLVVSGLLRLGLGITRPRREVLLLAPVLFLLAAAFLLSRLYNTAPPAYDYSWGKPLQKLGELMYEFERFGGRPAKPMLLMLVACLLWPLRHSFKRVNIVRPATLELLLAALAFLAVFLMLPEQYADSAFVDVRALPVAWLCVVLACLHLPDPALEGAPFAKPAVVLLGGLLGLANLGYLVIHLTPDDAWLADYRRLVAQLPPGARVLPVHTRHKQMYLSPFLHAGSLAVIDRGVLMPYLFAGDRGDAMKYFRYRQRPYMPDETWYLSQESWEKAVPRTFAVDGEWYRWRFDKETPSDFYWSLTELVPVNWAKVACDYDYMLISLPFNPQLLRTRVRVIAWNPSAALAAIDKGACQPVAQTPATPVQMAVEH